MDCDGILNAWTINVVPNRARITVTKRDSMYSRTVAGCDSERWAAAASRASTACAVSEVTLFLSSPQLPIVSGPRSQRIAPLLFSFSRIPPRSLAPQCEPRRETFSDDPGRSRQPHNRRPEPFPAIAKIPAARIYGRCDLGVRL